MPQGTQNHEPALIGRIREALAGGRGHALAALGVRVAAAGLAYLLQILLARTLGSADYGVFNITWNILTIGGFLATLGFSEIAVRFLAQYQERKEFALASGFLRVGSLVTLAGAALAALIGLLLLPVVRAAYGPLSADLLRAGLLALPFFALTDYYEGIARSQGWTIRALLPPYVLRQGFIILIVLVLLVQSPPVSPHDVMVATVVASIGAAVAQGFLLTGKLGRALPNTLPSYDIPAWRAAAGPTLLSDLALLAKLNIDLIVLGLFVEARLVGLYFAATRLASLLGLLEFAIKAGLGHRFARAAHGEDAKAALQRVYADARRLSFWPGLLGTAVLAALTPYVLRMFGPDFAEATPLALTLMAAIAFRLFIGPADEALAMAGRPNDVWRANGLGALVMGVGTALLAPVYAAQGAAIATLAGSLVASLIMLYCLRRRLGINPFARSGRAA